MKTFNEDISTRFTIEHNTGSCIDAELIMAQIKGEITILSPEADDEERKTIGLFSGSMFPLEFHEDCGFLYEAMDSQSQELMEAWEAISASMKNEAFVEGFTTCHHLVIIQSMEIEKAYRGRSVGLEVFKQIIEKLPSTLFVILPCPLNIFSDPKYETSKKCGRKKLTEYWKRLGFSKMNKGYYFLDNNCIHPELCEAVEEDIETMEA